MRRLSFYFQIHQPFRLRRYRFFDIGNDHYYYDDYLNESIMRKVAEKSYLRANEVMLRLLDRYEDFKVAFSVTGIALEQFELYAPEVLESFRRLAAHPRVEFLAETYAHSLASLANKAEFERQVKEHKKALKEKLGVTPRVFRNTELIYSDEIGAMVADMGFEGIITEGAKHVLGWKSPNYLYVNAINPRLKVLLKNFKMSDDIAFRFSDRNWDEWPLTAEKFAGWLRDIPREEEIIGLFMDYETFGEHQWEETGIFDFLEALPGQVLSTTDFVFTTPTEAVRELLPVSEISVPHPISWADEERDLTAWLGNELQDEAFRKLYALEKKIVKIKDPALRKDWNYLQASDHFYYMCTKFFSDGVVHSYFNPYDSPYDAFINFMNVLSDFEIRVNAVHAEKKGSPELARLTKLLQEKEKEIRVYEEELKKYRSGKSPKKVVRGKSTSKKTSGKKTSRSSSGTTTRKRSSSGK
jgi:alpha-amylase